MELNVPFRTMARAPEQWRLYQRQREYLNRLTAQDGHAVSWLGRIALPAGIPHPKIDSLLLAITAEPWAHGSILDAFSGSGIVGAHLLYRAGTVLFVDINPACIDFIRGFLATSVEQGQARALVADVYPDDQESFDLIVANPPYVDADAETMHERILFDRRHNSVRRFVSKLSDRLKPTGIALMTWASFSDFNFIEALFRSGHLDYSVQAEIAEPWPADSAIVAVYRVYRLQPRRNSPPTP
jgi:SAM-dependent methyltransferase